MERDRGELLGQVRSLEAALNEALGVVTYECAGCELGSDTISVEVDDGGFSGLGGPMTAAATVEVSIVRR